MLYSLTELYPKFKISIPTLYKYLRGLNVAKIKTKAPDKNGIMKTVTRYEVSDEKMLKLKEIIERDRRKLGIFVNPQKLPDTYINTKKKGRGDKGVH
jgi:hypothetical protein